MKKHGIALVFRPTVRADYLIAEARGGKKGTGRVIESWNTPNTIGGWSAAWYRAFRLARDHGEEFHGDLTGTYEPSWWKAE